MSHVNEHAWPFMAFLKLVLPITSPKTVGYHVSLHMKFLSYMVIDLYLTHGCENLTYEQGTTRPTHYHVLLDEVGFSADDLQELVHSLSYV